MVIPRLLPRLLPVSALLAVALLAPGCTNPLFEASDAGYRFFGPARTETDLWHDKIQDWQRRERRDRPGAALADRETLREKSQSGLLRVKMGYWEAEERLALAKRLTQWAQAESRRHYRFDPETDVAGDPWPTTKDLLDKNGDDCDGLDLIAYELLRQFGFPPDQLYRAIVKRQRDGANHMVTLWFDNPTDPWVIDAIGAVSLEVRRFSDLPGWTPTKIFNEQEQHTPTRLGDVGGLASASGP